MAKKQTDTVDYRAALLKRVKFVEAELEALHFELKGCINEKAQFYQFYTGKIKRAEAELAFVKALLDV